VRQVGEKMDYIKIRLTNNLEGLDPELHKTMENVFGSMNPMFSRYSQKWVPQMDLFETEDGITIIAALAGVDKDTLEIEINQRAVRISGSRKPPRSEGKSRFCLAEIQYGKFDRVLFLPTMIDTDKVSASFSAGMLKITMAKYRVPGPKKIPIKHIGD